PPPPCYTLFPYTTLFRSHRSTPAPSEASSKVAFTDGCSSDSSASMPTACEPWPGNTKARELEEEASLTLKTVWVERGPAGRGGRSEEHTSELQSRENLVC